MMRFCGVIGTEFVLVVVDWANSFFRFKRECFDIFHTVFYVEGDLFLCIALLFVPLEAAHWLRSHGFETVRVAL